MKLLKGMTQLGVFSMTGAGAMAFSVAHAQSVPDATQAPEPVQAIVRMALDNGCNVICFDPDGPVIDGLEWFDDPEPEGEA